MRVGLFGTCAKSTWREYFLKLNPKFTTFDPRVSDWNEEAKTNELIERDICDYLIYAITPSLVGYYSIFEVADDSNKRPDKTILLLLHEEIDSDGDYVFFDKKQLNSLIEGVKLIERNGSRVFYKVEDVFNFLFHENSKRK